MTQAMTQVNAFEEPRACDEWFEDDDPQGQTIVVLDCGRDAGHTGPHRTRSGLLLWSPTEAGRDQIVAIAARDARRVAREAWERSPEVVAERQRRADVRRAREEEKDARRLARQQAVIDRFMAGEIQLAPAARTGLLHVVRGGECLHRGDVALNPPVAPDSADWEPSTRQICGTCAYQVESLP